MAAKAWAGGQERRVTNGQSRCCSSHCRRQAGPGPRVSRSDADPSTESREAREVQRGFGGTRPPSFALGRASRRNGPRLLVLPGDERTLRSCASLTLQSQILPLLLIGLTSAEPHRFAASTDLPLTFRAQPWPDVFLKAHTKPKEEEQRVMKKPGYLPPSHD